MYKVDQVLSDLNKKHDHAIAILGGAYFAYESAKTGDIGTFVEFLPHVVTSAKYFKWHSGIAGALRQFCHICLVDPALVEVYLGVKFDTLDQ